MQHLEVLQHGQKRARRLTLCFEPYVKVSRSPPYLPVQSAWEKYYLPIVSPAGGVHFPSNLLTSTVERRQA